MVHVFTLKGSTTTTETSSRVLLDRAAFPCINTSFGDTTSIRQIKSEWIKLRLHIYTANAHISFTSAVAWQPPNMSKT